MDSINNNLDSLRWNTQQSNNETETERNTMKQEDFFSLLTTQLAAQDPTNPASNEEMISQMTSFTMAEGISDLGTKFDTFTSQFSQFLDNNSVNQTSNKALQASSMVGRNVLVESNESALFQYGEGAYGMAGQLLFSGGMNDIKVNITDSAGKVLETLDLGAVTDGPVSYQWDGLDADGNQMPPGLYQVQATGIDPESGQRTEISNGAYSTVSSVRFGAGNALDMNLAGLGSFSMDDIIEVAP
ncbi:flagellar hook assembly protein FlgD [Catenovulum sediminis]|uniref:Basal-body rod modification protein FlgD n=1 Tax=Catenovulum sediminis TaxID=1740262 RepID=A0ABV1RIR5_9ALTE|nr:FlgD immunoglobulin-like domain containing protein [Catenovulum sediminis]